MRSCSNKQSMAIKKSSIHDGVQHNCKSNLYILQSRTQDEVERGNEGAVLMLIDDHLSTKNAFNKVPLEPDFKMNLNFACHWASWIWLESSTCQFHLELGEDGVNLWKRELIRSLSLWLDNARGECSNLPTTTLDPTIYPSLVGWTNSGRRELGKPSW